MSSIDTLITLFHETGIYIPSRTVYLQHDSDDEEINHNTAATFVKNLHILAAMDKGKKEVRPATVILNTPGGDVTSGMAMYDAVKAFPGHITGIVLGQASSMGALILQAFDHRCIYRWGRIMAHDGDTTISGHPRDVERHVEVERQFRLDTYRILADRTGKPAKYWSRKLERDYIMSAQQALEEGLIDEII